MTRHKGVASSHKDADAPKEERATNQVSVVGLFRDVTTIAAIYLFFAGFIYRYYYFRGLGIPISDVNASLETVTAYSFSVFADNWFLALVAILAVVICWLFLMRAPRFTATVAPYRLMITFALALAAFPLLYAMARRTAAEEVLRVRLNPEVVFGRASLTIRKDRMPYPDPFKKAVSADSAYILEKTTSALYVYVRQTRLHNSKNEPPGFVYIVPNDDVANARTVLEEIPSSEIPVSMKGL